MEKIIESSAGSPFQDKGVSKKYPLSNQVPLPI